MTCWFAEAQARFILHDQYSMYHWSLQFDSGFYGLALHSSSQDYKESRSCVVSVVGWREVTKAGARVDYLGRWLQGSIVNMTSIIWEFAVIVFVCFFNMDRSMWYVGARQTEIDVEQFYWLSLHFYNALLRLSWSDFLFVWIFNFQSAVTMATDLTTAVAIILQQEEL